MTNLSSSSNRPLASRLEDITACHASVEWVQSFDSFESAYEACHDARWLMWLAIMTSYDMDKVADALDSMKCDTYDTRIASPRIRASEIHGKITRRYAAYGVGYFDELIMIPKHIDDKYGLSAIVKRYITCAALKAAFDTKR